MQRPYANWSKHFTTTPADRAAPGSEDELAGVLARTASGGQRVKVAGGGHSFSDIGLTDGVLITLDKMRRLIDLDEDRRRVTVQAGMRLHELVDALARRGLGLSILGSITRQSVAGAISTGTHGSSLRHGNLASFVCGMRLVTARGEILSLDETDERLAAARVSLGALGVITQVTFQCESLFVLIEEARRIPVDQLIRDLGAIARSAEYVKIWWLPGLPFANVYRYTRTDGAPTTSALWRWTDEVIVNRLLFAGLLETSRRWPQLTYPINSAVGAAYLRPSRRVGRYDRVLTIAMPPRHREMEYAVGMEQASDALDRLRAHIEQQKLRINFIVEVRFAKGDDAWMSPAYGRDSCQLGAYMADSVDLNAYFAGFERIMQELGGRPHWGKEHSVTPDQVRAVFPMAERFVALRRQCDPERIFDNPCLRRAFGPD